MTETFEQMVIRVAEEHLMTLGYTVEVLSDQGEMLIGFAKMLRDELTKGQLPVALKTHGAWDGLETLDDLPDNTALYAGPFVAAPAAAVAKDADGFPWVSLADAGRTELFNECRGIIGTENFGQDDALFRTLAHFHAAMQGKESQK